MRRTRPNFVWFAIVAAAAMVGCGARSEFVERSDASRSIDARPPSDVTTPQEVAPPGDIVPPGDVGPPPDVVVVCSGDAAQLLAVLQSPRSFAEDRVGPGDNGVTPDGQNDAALLVAACGPLTWIALVTADDAGNTAFGQQWDTLVGDQPMPREIGSTFSIGGNTWALGVAMAGSLINRANGSIAPTPAGPQTLTLWAGDSGYFRAGQSFRVYAGRTDGSVIRGPVLRYQGR